MLHVLSTPVLYAWELTPACNNRCVGCPNVFPRDRQTQVDGESAPEPPRFADWRAVLDRLAPHAQRLKLTGGEPTLHPDFQSIVEYLDVVGVEFVVFTNGRWLEPTALLDVLAGSRRLVGLLVSLHGAQAQSHESFTGVPGSFEETVENIRLAVAQGITVAISLVLTCHNVDHTADIVELSEQLGAHHVVFNRYLGPAIDGITPSPTDLARAARDIGALRCQGRAVKFGNCIPQCFIPNDSYGCLAGVAYCAVDPWGNVRPCTHSSLIAGNLLEQPVEEIWFSSTMQRFRDAVPPQCHQCSAFAVCHGGCKALAMDLGVEKDPLATDPLPASDRPPSPIHLHPDMRPVSRFVVRPEEWGLVLLRGNTVFPVRREAAPILEALDGQSTLEEIGQIFGPPALSLVGSLYQRGLITLVA
jgi:radical SAM protein with 4Fe4S-binding SPASM domain